MTKKKVDNLSNISGGLRVNMGEGATFKGDMVAHDTSEKLEETTLNFKSDSDIKIIKAKGSIGG